MAESIKTMRKQKINQTNRSTLKEAGTKLYERAENDRKELPSTTAPMVIVMFLNLVFFISILIENCYLFSLFHVTLYSYILY